jgi:hypothetical protein
VQVVHFRGNPALLPTDDLAEEFLVKFGRDMTHEERHFYALTHDLVENPNFIERRHMNSRTVTARHPSGKIKTKT